MNSLELYGVYLVSFPFVETDSRKVRPVIVISKPYGKYGLVTVIPITSQVVTDETELQLTDLKTTGLIVQSSTQIHRISTVSDEMIIRLLGCLGEKDVACLKSMLKLKLQL